MSNKKKIASMAFTGAAAAAMVGAHVGAAAAAGTSWKISPGNGETVHGVNVGNAILHATTKSGNGISLTCKGSTASFSGTVSGNGKSGVPKQLGTITKADFGKGTTHCTLGAIASVSASLTVAGIGLNASQVTTPNNATSGVVKGWVGAGSVTTNNIKAVIHGVGTFACTMSVSGKSLPGSFKDNSHEFFVNPGHASDLTITKASGCDSLFAAGKKAWFAATYSTSPSMTITGG